MNKPLPADELVVELLRQRGASVRITVGQFKGRSYTHVRIFENGYPSRKGVTLYADELEAAAAALTKAAEFIKAEGTRAPARGGR